MEEGTSVPVRVYVSTTQQITTDILWTVCAEMFALGLQKSHKNPAWVLQLGTLPKCPEQYFVPRPFGDMVLLQ